MNKFIIVEATGKTMNRLKADMVAMSKEDNYFHNELEARYFARQQANLTGGTFLVVMINSFKFKRISTHYPGNIFEEHMEPMKKFS